MLSTILLTITCCAAVKIAGSNAEKAAAAAAEELNCNCGSLGTFTYGATRHGSRGVDTFWCIIRPIKILLNNDNTHRRVSIAEKNI